MPPSRLGTYDIEGLLGAGGMGEVYRARDRRLGRYVAIKVVPQNSTDDAERLRRFSQEAQSAAALNHPHICTVHEFGHDAGIDFIVMELVDGRPLSDLIPSSGLPVPDVVHYGTQIAAALAHAHQRGVVHRDLKSHNVLITPDRQVKVVDFGLSFQLRPADAATMTRSGALADEGAGLVGTLPYLPPEALRGEATDARSDIWSFGVLLHEMAAGSLPFRGKTVPELSSAILRDAPASLPSGIPAGLAAIIRKCLAKNPADRYQSADQLGGALEAVALDGAAGHGKTSVTSSRRWVRAGLVVAVFAAAVIVAFLLLRPRSPAGGVPTVLAILPCRALGERASLGVLEVGIPDSVIIKLSTARSLRVRSTSQILPYQGKDIEPQEVGRTLAADYLVTCTLQPAGDRLAVSVQLISATDGSIAWGKQFNVDRRDILSLQDEIAVRTAEALSIRMTEEERERFYRRYTTNAEAYQQYLEGRAALLRFTRESTTEAIQHFDRALALDRDYALAHAGIASAAAVMSIRFAAEEEVQPWSARALAASTEALRLAPDLAEAHEARAAVARNTEFDWDRAADESKRALELNPSLEQPHFYLAAAFYHYGLLAQAEREVRLGMANNPVSRVEPLRLLGIVALLDGRFQEAVTHLQEAQRLSENVGTSSYLALALYNQQRSSEAEALLLAAGGGAQVERRAQAMLASFLAARGERQRARTLLDAVLAAKYRDHHVAYSVAAAYAQLGDRSSAMRWLAESARTGFPCYRWFSRDPLLAPLQQEADFRALLSELERRAEDKRIRFGG